MTEKVEAGLCSAEIAKTVQLTTHWLKVELEYANAKYGSQNPQLIGFGELAPGGKAWLDLAQYHKRFAIFYSAASTGEAEMLLNASQQLGKFVGSGRALVRSALQKGCGYQLEVADEITLSRLQERWVTRHEVKEKFAPDAATGFDQEEHWEINFEPLLTSVDEAIRSGNVDEVIQASETLLDAQMQMFVDFTYSTVLMAAPGFTSGEVRPWDLPELN